MQNRIFLLAVAAAAFSLSAQAQQPIAYPAKGQDQAQQNKDAGECQVWAKQQTGVDPAAVAQSANQPPPPAQKGQRVKGAAAGAVVGGVVDGGDGARTGAAVGMVAGGSRQRQERRAAQSQQQSQQQQAQGQMQTYNRAYSACMEGRGYTMK